MELKQTSKSGKGKAAHYHFAYFDPSSGGVTSLASSHVHVISIQPPLEPVVDPVSGIVLQAPSPGGPTIEPAGKDNHAHELQDLVFEEPETKKKDEDLVSENKELFRVGTSIEAEQFKLSEEAEAFYEGKQWDEADKTALKLENRSALTINKVESKLDLLSGYQRQNRSDFKFMPVEGGDGRVADALNVLVKNIVDQNDWEFAETDIFEDEAITGRGNIHAYIDYSNNIEGDIKLEHYPWRDVKYGPHNKKDGSDCEFIVKHKWCSKDYVQNMYPDSKNKLLVDWENWASPSQSAENPSTKDYGVVAKQNETVLVGNNDITSFINISKKEYMLVETERREYHRIPVVFCSEDGFYLNGAKLTHAQVNQITTIPGLKSVDQVIQRIRRVTTAGSVLLADDYLTDSDFSLIPVYAKKRGQKYWGKVEGIKDPQREVNKRHSQAVDIVNKMAAHIWFYDSDTFPNKEAIQKFKDNAAKPGFHAEVSDTTKPPVKTEGVTFPSELAEMMGLESKAINEILNINMEMAGQARSSQSGLAIQEQKRQGLIGNEFLFDNLNLSKKRLGRKIVRMIKSCYSPDRMMRILNSQRMQGGDVQLQNKPLGDYNPQELMELFASDDLIKYDVVVAESQFNPTNRLANFMIWSDLAGKGAPIPIMSLVDMSDAPDKEKMKAAIQAEMDRTAKVDSDKNQTEIIKTQIAHQGKQGTPPQGPA